MKLRLTLLTMLLTSGLLSAQMGTPLQPENWKLDIVHRNKGRLPLKGLVVKQSPAEIEMLVVFRKTGTPTVVMKDRVQRDDIARLDLLDEKEREQLTTRLDTLSRERKVLSAQIQLWKGGKIDIPAGEMLELKPMPWGSDGKQKGLTYESTYFKLESNAREDIVLLTAIQLEQLFAAYTRCLPPRGEETKMTTIVLTQSMEEYGKLVKARGHNILNPAFYDPRENQVVCGSDLERLGKELARVKSHHDDLMKDLLSRRAELVRVYKSQVPPELLGPVDEAIRKIGDLEKRNSDVVRVGHLRLVRCLCHEAFHAYLNTSVFGDRKTRVPTWLDEGLAQVFETALVEGGELQLGQPDPERLKRVRAALEKNELVPLIELLRSTTRQFQVAHTQEKQISDRYYLGAWAVAFYLTFEEKLLGSESLDAFLTALDKGNSPLDAFSVLVGSTPSEAEKKLHRYLQNLRQDGKSPMKK